MNDSVLRELVSKWRGPIGGLVTGTEWNGRRDQATACANELQAVLDSQPPARAPAAGEGFVAGCGCAFCDVGVTDHRGNECTKAAAPAAQVAVRGWSAEDACEAFIAAEVNAAQEALRRLGDWLCNVLDEDRQKTASAMVMGAMMETSAAIRSVSADAAVPAVVVDGYDKNRIFHPGDRVIWSSSTGHEFPGKIVKVNDRVTTYDAKLDDGSEAKDFAAGRFRPAALTAAMEGKVP